jgi:hypothetical protein
MFETIIRAIARALGRQPTESLNATGPGLPKHGPEPVEAFERQLTQRVATQGRLVVGLLQLLGLDDLRDALGENWAGLSKETIDFAAEEIHRALGPNDIVCPDSGPGFLVCFGSPDQIAAEEKAGEIKQRIEAGLLERHPDVAAAISIDHFVSKIPSAAIGNEQRKANALFALLDRTRKDVGPVAQRDQGAPAGDFEVLFAPVWHTRRQLTPFSRCFSDTNQSRSTSEFLALEAPTEASLELDCLLLSGAIDVLQGATLLVPVDFRTVSNRSVAVRYARLLDSMPKAYKAHLMLEICGLPNSYQPDHILTLINYLQPYTKFIAVELSAGDLRVGAVAKLGVWAVSLDLCGMSRATPKITAQLQQFTAAATTAEVSTIARGANSMAMATAAWDAGFTYIEGASILLPAKDPSPPRWLRPLPGRSN